MLAVKKKKAFKLRLLLSFTHQSLECLMLKHNAYFKFSTGGSLITLQEKSNSKAVR